ncbi:phosphatidate cytidylyltransferase [Tropicibacter naphthalenivorans]|uniref:Phosphatidate cytidylyltransferase n=1 Tax=Tropicibacter naphthalenivorans TaxID=441103 RepID=A0A0P1GN25_9RHOB|nr:phosphatidate cytidylyltransferase [Tropicibacter naphthalenivorans]CUH77174.1 Phosphatidate cytidylyltransferase [Tropicibacter naphthalenivorans]SMC60166.1 phosphatidate cytidylyltransferase [Tropicibacter naphthalenivorans]
MSKANWEDLAPRAISGVVMIGVGMIAVSLGGLWWQGLIALICGGMVWELVCMVDTGRTKSQYILAVATAVCALAAINLPPSFALPLLLLPSMLGFTRMERGGVTYAVTAMMIMLAGYSMMALRSDYGLTWMLWLVCVVVATDVMGYFAGKAIGGPKFWPRVSPKKTWSGTVGGWVGAALVGAFWAGWTIEGAGLIGISIAVSMASQIGDVAESAIKRKAGVKDSSHLIPGHGGLMDRFDGMLGASVFLVIAGQIVGFPPGV